MKFMHISDLHLGKRVNEFSMLEDQKDILRKILKIADEEKPQAFLIAGDVYDKSIPTVEAIQLFDDFLCELSKRKVQTFIISGNHDSAERMAFGGRLMKESGVYVAPVYAGKTQAVVLEDKWGPINIYLLPFVKPANIKRFFEDEQIENYTDAIRVAVEQMKLNTDERNVLVTHQFVTGAKRSESEDISVGGTDNVDASVFDEFDYVALGHIHGPQKIGRETVRYCGTPLKYSFSEIHKDKQATILTISKNKQISLSHHLLKPLRDMREMECSLESLLKRKCEIGNEEDYMHVILTDEEQILDAIGKVRTVYPNVMQISFKNRRHMMQYETIQMKENQIADQNPMELFEQFYKMQNHIDLDEKRAQMAISIFEEVIR